MIKKERRRYTKEFPVEDLTEELIPRLIAGKVEQNESGCWIWQGTKDRQDRAIKTLRHTDGHMYQLGNLHRIIFRCQYPEQFDDKMICIHLCHNRDCVNPNHVVMGSHTQNVAHEKIKYKDPEHFKGGTKMRLSPKKREEVRQRLINGESAYAIAKDVGVGHTSIIWHKKYLEDIGRLDTHSKYRRKK